VEKELFVTYNPIEASIIRAKLDDGAIDYFVSGDSNIAMTMETFNSELSRMALKQPIKFFVDENNFENAKAILERDNSDLLQDDYNY